MGVHSNVIWINHSGHDFAPQESVARVRERVLCRPVAVKWYKGVQELWVTEHDCGQV